MDYKKRKERITLIETVAESVTLWVGSVPSLVAHTLLFIVSFALPILKIVDFDKMLLVLTTIVSLEAIYLSIFIQMSVNKSSMHIEDIKEDIEEINEDIDEIQEDIDEIQEDIEEINEEEDEDDDIEDLSEKAKNVMLKSSVYSNTTRIKDLKWKIEELQKQLESLRQSE